jgi:hypothetical protein
MRRNRAAGREKKAADELVIGERHDLLPSGAGIAVILRLVLLELELPDVLCALGVGRATQPGRKPSDVAKIVTLSLRGDPRKVISSIRRWRSGLIGPIWTSSFIVRILG